MNIEIGLSDLKAVIERKKGLSGVNVGPLGCTAPWSRLQKIGLSTIDNKEGTFSGQVRLIIGKGGVRDRNCPKYSGFIFRKEVMPAIKNFAPDCSGNFHLILHYRENLLFRTELENK